MSIINEAKQRLEWIKDEYGEEDIDFRTFSPIVAELEQTKRDFAGLANENLELRNKLTLAEKERDRWREAASNIDLVTYGRMATRLAKAEQKEEVMPESDLQPGDLVQTIVMKFMGMTDNEECAYYLEPDNSIHSWLMPVVDYKEFGQPEYISVTVQAGDLLEQLAGQPEADTN